MISEKHFVLMGAAGYVAPRHMDAIRYTGNRLLAAYDPCDRMGVLDSYFPDADFFLEYEQFDRYVNRLRKQDLRLDYVTVCTPNYLHDAHIRFGLKHHADVICEKPLVLLPHHLEALIAQEKESGRKVFCILQLRLHPVLQELKKRLSFTPSHHVHDVELTYITPRGKWYYMSWKADEAKSGGVATNIGIHFFDLLYWLFGNPQETVVHIHTHDRAAGYFRFAQAKVKWFVSINGSLLEAGSSGRAMTIDGETFSFDQGFHDLHRASYAEILHGRGVEMEETRTSVEMAHLVRSQPPDANHPFRHHCCDIPLAPHPLGF